jgi:hypothetical protein
MKSLLVLAALSASHPSEPPMSKPYSPDQKVAVVCFKSGERMSGMNRICYYDCLGSTYAITVGVAELCPLSINN